MGAKRKSYTPAYRREAAHLVIDTERTIVEVAREIGVGEQLLGTALGFRNLTNYIAYAEFRISDGMSTSGLC